MDDYGEILPQFVHDLSQKSAASLKSMHQVPRQCVSAANCGIIVEQ